MLSHSGPRIAAFTMLVTHACPSAIDAGGCSLLRQFGTIHDTAGSEPALASRK